LIYFIKSFGCKVNIAEEELLSSKLTAKGYRATTKIDDANTLIINSCAVTSRATKKVLDYINKIKISHPAIKIILTGCVVNENILDISTLNADIIVDNFSKSSIINLIADNDSSISNISSNTLPTTTILEPFFGIPQYKSSKKTRSYFKIQDGCDAKCSYCIIPTLRGASVSIPFNDAISNFKKVLSVGYKEIVLVGIHIGLYGKEFGLNFIDLVKELIKIDGDYRIRFSSLEINEITDELIDLIYTHQDKIASHLHIPLQSGSNKILSLMNRHYTSDDYIKIVSEAKKRIKNLTVGSDIIVGFPEELDTDFDSTIKTLKEAGTDFMHIFQYSDRKGTVASTMSNKVPANIKKERAIQLKLLADSQYNKLVDASIGKNFRVLSERGNKGHTSNYLTIYFKQTVKENTFYNVTITEYKDNKLYGDVI